MSHLAISASARRTIQRGVIRPVWWIVGIVALFAALPFDIPLWVQFLPLAFSALLFGMPHGAVDHIVPGRIIDGRYGSAQMIGLVVGYLALIGAMLAMWTVNPAFGFVFFIAMTWVHWGLGDLHAVLAFGNAGFLHTRGLRALTAFVRGGFPMLLPLVFFPTDFRLAADSIVGTLGLENTTSLDVFFGLPFRMALAVIFGCTIGIVLVWSWQRATRTGQMADWRAYALETFLLTVFFAVVPAYLAVGLYFCLWHSTRHITRLALLHPPSQAALETGRIWGPFWQFTKQALPTTMIALAMLAGLYVLVPRAPDDFVSLIALYLILIAALTLPHTVVVMWMDVVQGVWEVPDSSPMRASSQVQV